LLKIRIDKNGISLYQLTIYPGHKDQHITFCTPEATEAIDSYLSYRIRAGEQLNDQSPLFRRDFRADDLFKVRNNIKPIETDAVSKKIQTILRESGLLSKYQTITESQVLTRHEVQRNHQHSNDFG
jgi:hypothetical protein